MASDSLQTARKPARVVKYGKNSKRASYETLADDDKDEIKAPIRRTTSNVKATFRVNKNVLPSKLAVKPTKERAARAIDLFDVPSSGDEASPVKRNIPPALRVGSLANEVIQSPQQKLAPWETQQMNASISSRMERLRVSRNLRPGSKQATDLAPQGTKPTLSAIEDRSPDLATSDSKSQPMSAAGRLAMRKKPVVEQTKGRRVVDVSPKRTASLSEQGIEVPRKRLRMATTAVEQDEDAIMHDVDEQMTISVAQFPAAEVTGPETVARKEQDMWTNGQGVQTRSDVNINGPEQARGEESLAQKPSKRRAVEVSIPIQKFDRSPSIEADDCADTLTPKQKQLWAEILPVDMKATTLHNSVSLFSEDKPVRRRRTRLVDRLKAAAESSGDDSDHYTDQEDGTVDSSHIGDAIPTTHNVSSSQGKESRRTTSAENPKVTYAKQRSYLQEDSLEDGLLLDLQPLSTGDMNGIRSRNVSHGQASSKFDFELEDSEDEKGPARLRTIHELRAAGRNISFMQDTEAIMEDIANHNKSGIGRRRSAFMELATKMADKAYVTRFVASGYEERLVAEFGTAADDIADFALAAAIALMLAHDVPQQTMNTLVDGEVITWMSSRLVYDVEMKRLTKERRYNMSRATKTTLSDEFVPLLLSQEQLWKDSPPQALSFRLAAMKVLELCIMRLRKDGNNDGILTDDELLSLVGKQELSRREAAEINTLVSILEALSTSAACLQWPQNVIVAISELLPTLSPVQGCPQHTSFLMLRLALNLTNDNARNCEILAQSSVVLYLMDMICASFTTLEHEGLSESNTALLDLLILALGIMINLAEQNEAMRAEIVTDATQPIMLALLSIFTRGQRRAQEAESMEQSTANVAYGYLAIMLANICQSSAARKYIVSKLPGCSPKVLIDAVAEFVMHHQLVDKLELDGDEGHEVWSTFTGRLQAVLERLQAIPIQD